MNKVFYLFLSMLFLAPSTTVVAVTNIEPLSLSTILPDSSSVKDAVNAFNNLSKKEKKEKIKEVKKEIKAFKAERKANNEPSTNTLLLVILAILLPPLAVYLHQGEINSKFWISLLLTLLFWVPGVIYALIVVLGNE